MPSIHVLPDMLVKKIAAGEVIERPSSVVKELLENAVDAGATRIHLAVEQGGARLIHVSDDGCGMTPDDLKLAVTPHATSKLTHADDLYRIDSLGFRGEALASIGAVSRVRIVSRTPDAVEGAEIIVEAETVRSNRAAGCPPGTTVEARDLFFNVPARRKFLRAAGTEYGQIQTQFTRIALAHPHIAFALRNNGRIVHQLPKHTSRLERLAKFYSRELADCLLTFRRDEAGLVIEGYAAPPADARSSTNWQLTFLNGRFIRDRSIQHAIRESYRGLIDPHRHPIVFLFLTIEPERVDVNVHPTKIEVRWRDANVVHSQVLSVLRETLQAADLTPSLHTDRASRQPASGHAGAGGAGLAAPDPREQTRLLQSFAEEFKRTPPLQPSPACDAGRGGAFAAPEASRRFSDRSDVDAADIWAAMYGAASGADAAEPAPARAEPVAPQAGPAPGAIQLHNTYLVCETDDGMVIIDQHALHERILFEQLKGRIAGGRLEAQRLLLPETVHVTPERMALLEAHERILDRIGLEVSPFGTDAVAVQSAPSLLKDVDVAGFLTDLLDLFERNAAAPSPRGGADASEDILYDLLSMMACKAAVKAGDPLTPDEIRALIDRKQLVEKSSNCPHGRPTTLRLSVKDLERQFKRT